MDLAKLCSRAGLPIEPGDTDGVDVGSIDYRSDQVAPGSLFCCLRGAKQDGHEFAAAAVERGAVALVVERTLPLAVPQVHVGDARSAMGLLAAELAGAPSDTLDVVGLTGTNGKTTTSFLVAGILDAAGRRCGLVGTVEQRIGGVRVSAGLTTPESPELQRAFRQMLEAGDRTCAIEASSIAISQRRLVGTRFAAVAFTNLSQDHLDFHGDMETYFESKAELFDGRFPRAVNAADAYGRRLGAELRFGAGGDVTAADVRLHADRSELVVRTPRGELALTTRVCGAFNVENVLCAVALALLLDVPDEAIVRGLAETSGPPGRFEPIDCGQPFGVFVDYAHTPAGLDSVLAAVRPMATGRVLCVFGAGGDRDPAKRPLMGAAAEAGADAIYVTSDNPRSEPNELIVEQILAGLRAPARATVEHDRRAAIARALAEAGPGDVVVIAGKGHEQGQDVGGIVPPFDDRAVARELLRA